jgi:hypothetical protein
MEVSSQLHARQLYSQGNSPWYPMDRRLDGSQYRYGRCDEEKNYQSMSGLEPPIIQSVTQLYTTELSRPLLNNITFQYVLMKLNTSFFNINHYLLTYNKVFITYLS